MTLLEWLQETSPQPKEGQDPEIRQYLIDSWKIHHDKEVFIIGYDTRPDDIEPNYQLAYWIDPDTYSPTVYIWEVPEGILLR